jgi:predicted DNA-binding transcriptional regulator YafY
VRADRLVAILLMLQQRGRVTAADVARELEVSERTARRDLDALGLAGLPIFSIPGRNGGWELAGGGRTDLSGLNAAEARALFLVAGPSSTATPAVKAALRKLLRALPEPLRADAEATTASIVVDPAGWERGASARRPAPPRLDDVQRAVVQALELTLEYVARDGTRTTRCVHPLGLAAKGPIWYLLADTDAGLRTFRVDRIAGIEPTGRAARRPPDFELEAAWRLVVSDIDDLRAPVRAQALVDADALRWLRHTLGTRVRIAAAQPDGRVEVELRGHNETALARELAGFADMIEVRSPPGVRAELARLGTALADTYAPPNMRP